MDQSDAKSTLNPGLDMQEVQMRAFRLAGDGRNFYTEIRNPDPKAAGCSGEKGRRKLAWKKMTTQDVKFNTTSKQFSLLQASGFYV
jgi:hypothetical protein